MSSDDVESKLGDQDLAIGEVARRTGLTTATIHFYVKEGVLPAPRRVNRTRAAYGDLHVRAIKVVKRMQAVGASLQQIKAMMDNYGGPERSLGVLEGVGRFHPVTPPRTLGLVEPIEPFGPIDREAFLARSGADGALVDQLLAAGLVIPRKEGFDHHDLNVVLQVRALLADGMADPIAHLAPILPLARDAADAVGERAMHHLDALRTRALRFSDLLEPWRVLFGYLVTRNLNASDPNGTFLITAAIALSAGQDPRQRGAGEAPAGSGA